MGLLVRFWRAFKEFLLNYQELRNVPDDVGQYKDIFDSISYRIYHDNSEGVESLFALIPETSSRHVLNAKYFWLARYYLNSDNIKKSIYYFNLMDEKYDKYLFNSAYLWLGRIYLNTDVKKSIECWEKISKKQKKIYYQAQMEMEEYYYRVKDYSKSILCLLELLEIADDIAPLDKNYLYWELSHSYRINNQNEKAKEYLQRIPVGRTLEYGYALIEYYILDNTEDSKNNLLLIEQDWSFAYDLAQFHLGNIAWGRGNKEQAINNWLQVTDKDHWCYQEAQTNLFQKAINYALENKKYDLLNDLLLAITLQVFKYEIEILRKALGLIEYFEDSLFSIYLVVEKIKKVLQINLDSSLNSYSLHVAHYTSCYVAKIILGTEIQTGSLQLSVADLMNDPTEGKILHYILGQPNWLTHRFNHRYYQAYASCFSFNHDSLNQFRLYGKEAGKEATGVSMVFDIDMFAHNAFSANISLVNDIKKSFKSDDVENLDKPIKSSHEMIKYPIYHCIYYDPKSDYYKLAGRAEMTFYRQGKIDGKLPDAIRDDWEEYLKIIKQKEGKLKNSFNELKDTLVSIDSILLSMRNIKVEKTEKVTNLINDILLPIQFLVKHAAYIEEDECRMLYITNAGSDVIKEQSGRLYIEYEPSVVEYLDKIYLSDGAKDERAFLERAWQKALDRDGITDQSIDIRDSDNPFRI